MVKMTSFCLQISFLAKEIEFKARLEWKILVLQTMMMTRYWGDSSLNGGGYDAQGKDFPIKPHRSRSQKILPFLLYTFKQYYSRLYFKTNLENTSFFTLYFQTVETILLVFVSQTFTHWKQNHLPSSKILHFVL